jgi:hypothetical protein
MTFDQIFKKTCTHLSLQLYSDNTSPNDQHFAEIKFSRRWLLNYHYDYCWQWQSVVSQLPHCHNVHMIFGVKRYTKCLDSKLWRRWMLVYHFGNGLWWSSLPRVSAETTSKQLTWDGSVIQDSIKWMWNFDQVIVWPMSSPTPESLVGVTRQLGWMTPTRIRMPHDEWSKWPINEHSPLIATTDWCIEE